MATADPPADGPRERLLGAALRLFAEEGLKGVSMRRIVAAAGAANPSALHSHVGDRSAVVAALAESICAQLRAAALPRLAALERAPHGVRDVLVAMFQPVVAMRGADAEGPRKVQFLARLSWEFGEEGQRLSAAGLAPIAEQALGLLERRLPGHDPAHLRLKLMMAMTNVFHGLADLDYMQLASFGPGRLLEPGHARLREELLFDYLEAGLTSPPR